MRYFLLCLAFSLVFVLVACGGGSVSQPAPAEEAAPSEVITTTEEIAPSEEITTTEEVTSTEEVAPSEEMTSTVEPSEEMTSTVEPSEEMTSTVEPSEEMTPTVEPSEEMTPTVEPSEEMTPTVEPSEEMTPTVEPSEEVTETVGMNAVQVELVNGEINMPESIPAGTTVFEVTNAGDTEHNFGIDGITEGFEQDLQPGETQTIEVDLTAGEYIVYCPVDDHQANGMELTLTVTQP